MIDVDGPFLEDWTVDLMVVADTQRPRVLALVQSIARAARLYEQALHSVYFGHSWPLASNAQLDLWGKLLGLERGLLDNQEFRLLLEQRTIVRMQELSVPRLIAVLESIVPTRTVSVVPNPPKGAAFFLVGGPALDPSYIDGIRRLVANAGVPPGDAWYVATRPVGALAFGEPISSWTGKPWPEIVFGGA